MTHISQNIELREAQVSAIPLSWLQVSPSKSCPGLCILVIRDPKKIHTCTENAVATYMEPGVKIFRDIRISLVVQWLRLCTPKAGGPGSIPGQGTRPHMLQLRPSAAK